MGAASPIFTLGSPRVGGNLPTQELAPSHLPSSKPPPGGQLQEGQWPQGSSLQAGEGPRPRGGGSPSADREVPAA